MLAHTHGKREHLLRRQNCRCTTFSLVLLKLSFEFTLDNTDIEFSLTLQLSSETILEVKKIWQLDLIDVQSSSNIEYAQVETPQQIEISEPLGHLEVVLTAM